MSFLVIVLAVMLGTWFAWWFDITAVEANGAGWRVLAWPFRKLAHAWRWYMDALENGWPRRAPAPPPKKIRLKMRTHEGTVILDLCSEHLIAMCERSGGGMTLWSGFLQDAGRVSLDASTE